MDERKRNSRENMDTRTPIAWQHRDMNHQPGVLPASSFRERYSGAGTASSSGKLSSNRSGTSRNTNTTRPLLKPKMNRNSEPPPPFRGSSASPMKDQRSTDVTSTESVSDFDSEEQRKEIIRPETRGTMHSTASMPLLAPIAPTPYGQMVYGAASTWDGEPCPVHGANSIPPVHGMPMYHPLPFAPTPYPNMYPAHHLGLRRATSVHDFNFYGPGPFMGYRLPAPAGTRAASVRGSVIMMPHKAPSLPPIPPPNLLPPLQRPRLALTEKKDQKVTTPPLPPKIPPPVKKKQELVTYKTCCKGNILVLWSILAVIAFGVVLGVVLSYIVR
ncbi:WAS/WASL-interacting protein family member 3-like [Artemia franciscana]